MVRIMECLRSYIVLALVLSLGLESYAAVPDRAWTEHLSGTLLVSCRSSGLFLTEALDVRTVWKGSHDGLYKNPAPKVEAIHSVMLEKANNALELLGLPRGRHQSASSLHKAHDLQTRRIARNKRKSFTVALQYLLSLEGKEALKFFKNAVGILFFLSLAYSLLKHGGAALPGFSSHSGIALGGLLNFDRLAGFMGRSWPTISGSVTLTIVPHPSFGRNRRIAWYEGITLEDLINNLAEKEPAWDLREWILFEGALLHEHIRVFVNGLEVDNTLAGAPLSRKDKVLLVLEQEVVRAMSEFQALQREEEIQKLKLIRRFQLHQGGRSAGLRPQSRAPLRAA